MGKKELLEFNCQLTIVNHLASLLLRKWKTAIFKIYFTTHVSFLEGISDQTRGGGGGTYALSKVDFLNYLYKTIKL